MRFETRPAAEHERLNIDEEADDLPEGVVAIDFGEYPIFCDLDQGEHVVEMAGVSGFADGQWVIQVTSFLDSGFIKRL